MTRPAYDANGNRTTQTDQSNTTVSFAYDQANRLVAFGSAASYSYNGDGLRMSKTVSGASSAQTWDVAEALPLLIGDDGLRYVTGPGGLPLEQVNGDGSVWYVHADQLGSTRALTDQSGAVVVTYAYDAYGNQIASTGTASTPLRYAGQYLDVESGYYRLRGRYYDPNSAQFTTVDPQASSTRQRYTYGADAPLDNTDPSGQFSIGGGICPGLLELILRCDPGRHVEFRLQRCGGPPAPDRRGGASERHTEEVAEGCQPQGRTRYDARDGPRDPGVASEAAGRPVK